MVLQQNKSLVIIKKQLKKDDNVESIEDGELGELARFAGSSTFPA